MAKGDIQILSKRIKFTRIQVTQLDPPNEGHLTIQTGHLENSQFWGHKNLACKWFLHPN